MNDHDAAAEMWDRALTSSHGVRIETDDVQRLVAVLYEHKRKTGDARMLQFSISQRGSCVLIAKTKPTIKTNGGYRPMED